MRIRLLAFCRTLVIPEYSGSTAASAQTSSSCELRPVMIENFDEETAPNRSIESISPHRIGPARWTAHTPWSGDFGDAAFVDPEPSGPFKIKDGILSISASKKQEDDGPRVLLPPPMRQALARERVTDISRCA